MLSRPSVCRVKLTESGIILNKEEFGYCCMMILSKKVNKRPGKPLAASKLIAIVFLLIIICGALLLMLPVSSRDGASAGVWTAIFTAVSSTCVTGLSLVDTWTQWSGFGQVVILCLIEVGGLGFMTAASVIVFALRKRMGMSHQMLVAQSVGSDDMGDIIRIQKRVLTVSLVAQLIGAAILTVRFFGELGLVSALKIGIFHSVSAYCNAGFDIFGFEQPGTSIVRFGTDPTLCLTLAVLIIVGGIGFLVWDEILRVRSPKKWSVYTRLVLITSAALIVAGTTVFCIAEWNNPDTLGSMSPPEKLLAGFFQSVTARTAGFAGIDQGELTDAGKAITMFFMLIGGSSGSTAGGLKTVTFIIIILFLWSRVRGRDSVSVFRRTVSDKSVLDALLLCGIMVMLSFIGATVICATSDIGFTDGLYESISALATVGLTTGVTHLLSVPSRILIMLYMYFGRVGILTISLGFLRKKGSGQQYRYAQTNLLIG